MGRRKAQKRVWVTQGGDRYADRVSLAREIPFTIQVRAGQAVRNVVETLRTPGHDYELAAGLLYGEGYIRRADDLSHMTYCMDDVTRQEYNLLTVVLRGGKMPVIAEPSPMVIDGVACGTSSSNLLQALAERELPALSSGPMITREIVQAAVASLPAQPSGMATAGLFTTDGEARIVRTDVDPLHALEKVIGWGVLQDHLPFADSFLVLSGPGRFRTLQRCAVAGIPLVCVSGGCTSLAVSVAHRRNMTLIAATDGKLTIFTGERRLLQAT